MLSVSHIASTIPQDPGIDNSLALLNEGYSYISRRCDRFGSDIFATRLMLHPVICMRGAEAARLLYDGARFTRQGAMPTITVNLLQGKSSVQALDGDRHRVRKQMFMSLMTPDALARLAELFARHWRDAAQRWAMQQEVVLLSQTADVLTRTACEWCGLPATPREAAGLARQFGMMIAQAGSIGPATLVALRERRKVERCLSVLVQRIRDGEVRPPDGSAAAVIAHHSDIDGLLIPAHTAAVELINIMRPTVAVNRFIVFAALALHQNPEWRERLSAGDADLECFVQEVRRFYPFFPFIGGRALQAFEWRGHHFAQGDWVVLDLHGTNHHPALWPEPHRFLPQRFRDWQGDPFTLIPQGAGDFLEGHRCPGEWATITLLKQAVRLLCRDIRYDVPPQDLSIPLSRIPTAPASGFVISNVRSGHTSSH